MSLKEREIKVERPRCPFCHDDLQPEQPKTGCETCLAWHHAECWSEHGKCGSCGAGGDASPAGATPDLSRARALLAQGRREDDPSLPDCREELCDRKVHPRSSNTLCGFHERQAANIGAMFMGALASLLFLIGIIMLGVDDALPAVGLCGSGLLVSCVALYSSARARVTWGED